MATNNGGSLSFDIKLMLDKLQADVQKANAELAKIGKTATDEGKKIDTAFNSISKSIAGIGAAFSAQQLARQIIQVRGEFEKLEVSFNTMLRSEEKASALMNQLVKTAATTPFGLQDVAGGAKQLLAYGMEAEKINETLIRLGDIAAGLNIPLQDMTYLFGTTMVQGRMYTQDLNQFVGRGIPLIKEFANQFGVAESKVKDLVTEGKIGFPQLQKAIIAMTSEGGQFAGLMEAQSKTIAGQIANLEDAIDMMFNELGKASQGVISESISIASALVENYEQVGRVLLSLVGVYGVYKTAVIAMTAIYGLQAAGIGALTTAEKLHYAWLVLVEKAQKILNTTMLSNPYVLVATAIAGVVAYLIQMKDKAEESQRVLNEAISETNKAFGTEIDKLDNLKKKLEESEKGSEEWKKAKDAIVSQYGQYLSNLDAEIEKTGTLASTYDALTDAVRKSIAARGLKKFYDENSDVLGDSQNTLAEMRKKLVEKYGEKYVEDNWKAVTSYFEKGAIKDLDTHMRHAFPEKGANKELYGDIVTETFFGKKGDAKGFMAEMRLAITTARENNDKFYANLENFAKANSINVDEMNEILYGIKNNKVEEATTPTTTTTTTDEIAEDNAKKEAERRLKLQQQLADDLLKMQQDNQQREIDAMDEGTAKRLAQIRFDFNTRKEEIKKQADEWKKQNIEAGIATDESGLTAEQSKAIRIANEENEKARKKSIAEIRKEEQQAMRDYLKEYGNYQEKRLAITEDYAERIKKAQNDGERKTLEAERDKTLADLDTQATKTTSAIGKLFADISDKSIAELRKLAKDGQDALDFIKGKKWDAKKGEQFKITEEMFKNFNADDIEQIARAIKQITKSADDSEPAFVRLKKAIRDTFNGDDNDLKKNLDELKSALDEVSRVGDLIADTFDSFGELFGNDTLKTIGLGFSSLSNIAQGVANGAQLGLAFGEIGATIGSIVGGVQALASSLASISKTLNDESVIQSWMNSSENKEIKRLRKELEELIDEYEDLSDDAEKKYSSDAASAYEVMNKKLEEQRTLLIEIQKQEESRKTKNEESLRAVQNEIDEVDKQIEDNKEAAIDAIFGEDIQSAIENFTDAYVGAWSDGSVKIKDIVRQMMQNVVKESIKETLKSSKTIAEIRQKMMDFYADGIFQQWEQDELYKLAEQAQKDLDKDFAWAEDLFKDTTAQQASNGGFQAMSQDTGSELNGRFTTMVELQSLQLDKVNALALDTALIRQNITEMRNLSLLSIGHLESIAKNTNELYQMNARLGKIEEYTSRL